MRRIRTLFNLLLATTVLAAALQPALVSAQTMPSRMDGEAKYELGAGVMGSFYNSKALNGNGGSASAGFDPGYGASIWLGQNMYNRVGGELRYDYLTQNMKLASGSEKVTFGSRSHAFHYDLHFHFADRGAKVRPYVLVGGGVKRFEGTGAEQVFQPLQTFAVLTHTSEIAPMFTFGAGIKFQISPRINLRLDFRDNVSPFPKKLIAPTRASGGDGWVHNFLPTVGISLTF